MSAPFTTTQHREKAIDSRTALYHTLGAHLDEFAGTPGTRFAVWAPNASEVSVLCNGNGWTPGQDSLNSSDSGVWSGFVPGLGQGELYKYAVRTQWGEILQKADPVAFYAETPPKSASIVWDLGEYPWEDAAWMESRPHTDWHARPITVYEVHLGSWKRPKDGRRYLNYRELAHQLIDYVREMGYTHIQLMPVTEHPFDGSWGYQTTGYFAPTSRYGTPDDFRYFIDYCHRSGIGVLIDWVPAHFPTDAHGLGRFDGTALYEHEDPRKGFHPDWNTYIFNYGRHEVREFLLASARFWFDEYHIDGIRVDAVASMLYLDYSRDAGQWIPNQYGGRENLEAIQFLKDLNVELHGEFPGILTVAEESTAWGGVSHPVYAGGIGFNMKWDMGWMNDTLEYMHHDPVHRKFHQNELSFRMIYAYTENFVLPLSHDEVVHGKRSLLSQMPGDYWQQFANLRLLYGYQYAMSGKKLLFMGGEFGQWTEWNHDEEIDWALFGYEKHDGLRRLIGDLNHLYRTQPALYETDFDPEGFRWIQCDDWHNSVFAFQRTAKEKKEKDVGQALPDDNDVAPARRTGPRTNSNVESAIKVPPGRRDLLIAVLNFTPVPRENYRIGVPRAGEYAEILNTDAAIYGGSNLGNQGRVATKPIASHGSPHSILLTLPPLAMVLLKPA